MESEETRQGTTSPDTERADNDNVFDQLNNELGAALAEQNRTMAELVQAGKPLLGCVTQSPPELWAALNVPFWISAPYVTGALASPEAFRMIDYPEQLGVTPLMCSFVKVSASLLHLGGYPTPTMVIGASEPCDGNVEFWNMVSEYRPWAKIPKFLVDIPYDMDKMGNDDPAVRYLAGQLKANVSFVEEHSGLKMDMDRLKEVCEESNRACQLRLEFQEMSRAIPTPVSFEWAFKIFIMSRVIACGKPETTEWIQRLADAAATRVKDRKGIEGVTEKVRFLWYDVAPIWGHKLFPRLEKDFGAVLVQELNGWCPPIEAIDTSTEENIYQSLARRYGMLPPMTRQGMVSLDQYCEDLVRIVKDYRIDAVILPGHVGHRNTNAVVKICGDVCREIGVPSLFLGCDVWDERQMTPDEVYEKIARFLYATNLA